MGISITQNPTMSRKRKSERRASKTHVFSDHRDLVNFLGDELARDKARETYGERCLRST